MIQLLISKFSSLFLGKNLAIKNQNNISKKNLKKV